jgi:penicillin G amidase
MNANVSSKPLKKWHEKWYVRVILVLLIIAILLSVLVPWYVRRPWAQTSGNLTVDGLIAPVTVIRDTRGVPQIYAENEPDLFFAQGYVTAQDRLWQILFHKQFISGRMSEIVGERTLGLDRYFRTWQLHTIAEESYAKLDDDTKQILDYYVDGVNAYVDTHRDSLPLEFVLSGLPIEKYTPVDCLLWANFMAVHQAQNWSPELLRAQIIAKLGKTQADDLLPPVLAEAPIIVPPGSYEWMTAAKSHAQSLGLPTVQESITSHPAEMDDYQWLLDADLSSLEAPFNPMVDSSFWGSGAWVISGEHTASGKPILASDAHLNLLIPSFWYEIGLHGGRFNVTGFSFAGVPFIALGHNDRIAWGYTLMNPDVVDLYAERVDDKDNPTQYEFEGKWYPFEKIVHEEIKVKGGETFTQTLHFTRHGPLVPHFMSIFGDMEKNWPSTRGSNVWQGENVLALSWPMYEGNTVVESAMKLNLAGNWDEFHAAVKNWESLSLDFVYADVDGNIGFQAAGKVPIRRPNHSGLVPVPGWTGEYEHLGHIPVDMLPGYLNPESGFIAVANNVVVSEDYPFSLTRDIYHEGYRIMRITSLIEEKIAAGKPLTMEDMHTIQMDTYSLPAQELRPYALSAVTPANATEQKIYDELKNWDLWLETDRVGASVWEVWYQFMLKYTFSDEMIEKKVWGTQTAQKAVMALVQVMPDNDNIWFDDITTPERETRDDIARRSFTETAAWLTKNYGNDINQWQWGKVHRVRITHFLLDAVPVIKDIFGSQVYSFPGDPFTVNLAYSANFSYSDGKDTGFWVWVAAQQRQIIDLGDWNTMLAIDSTGQNGNVFHPQREDQVPLWVEGKYATVSFDREAAEKTAAETLILNPAK